MSRIQFALLVLILTLAVGAIAFVAVDGEMLLGFDRRASGPYVYRAPEARSDGLKVADAVDIGLDTARLRELVEPFLDGRRGQAHSLLVMQDGQLIIEEYFHWSPTQRHTVQSVSKSITSLLVGHALQRGYIKSIDEPIGTYLPKYRHLLTGGKERITIRHLLTMTSGLEWNEANPPYSDTANMRVRELRSPDGVAFVLARPLTSQPGEVWAYNGGGMTLLGDILENASGLSAKDFILQAFDGMLTSREIEPTFQDDGRLNASGGFQVTPRGLAKIGQMVLDHGRWNDKPVFDAKWIDESTAAVVGRGRSGYGYLWWRLALRNGGRLIDAIVANGYGGQHLVVIPSLRVVAVFNAVNYETETSMDTLMAGGVFRVLGPIDSSLGRAISFSNFDRAYVAPPGPSRWAQVLGPEVPPGGITIDLDTANVRRLADGSFLVWTRTFTAKPRFEADRPYTRVTSRFVVRCETPTDGRIKRVSTTGFADDGTPLFQDIVGLDAVAAQPWVPIQAGSLDLTSFRRTCDLVTGRR